MSLIVGALGLSVIAVIVVVVQMRTKQHKPDGTELAIVAEIPETAIFGVALALLGFFMLIAKLRGMDVGGTDATSFTFIAVFGIVLVIAGAEIMLMSFIKRTIAYKDKIVSFNSYGKSREIPWVKVTGVSVQPLSRTATFKSAKESISVNGKREEYVKLVQVASEKIPGVVASDDLGKLLRRLAK